MACQQGGLTVLSEVTSHAHQPEWLACAIAAPVRSSQLLPTQLPRLPRPLTRSRLCSACYGGPEAPKVVTHRELRNSSGDVLRRVSHGESITVTNHGEVVAVLVPPDQGRAARTVPPKMRGGFSNLKQVALSETVISSLDDLRGE